MLSSLLLMIVDMLNLFFELLLFVTLLLEIVLIVVWGGDTDEEDDCINDDEEDVMVAAVVVVIKDVLGLVFVKNLILLSLIVLEFDVMGYIEVLVICDPTGDCVVVGIVTVGVVILSLITSIMSIISWTLSVLFENLAIEGLCKVDVLQTLGCDVISHGGFGRFVVVDV